MALRLWGTSACLLVAAFALSACSGSDGGGVSPAPSPPTTPSPTPSPAPSPAPVPTPGPAPAPAPGINYNTAEYQQSGYAVAANAIAAYDAGATGQGVKIGIVDSGLNPSLPEFAGRIDPASGDVTGSRGLADEGGHGTAVSAVAAAARNGQNTLGVAFNSTIVMERADSPGTCSQANGCQFYDNGIASGIDAARAAGAKVINLSLGGSTPGSVLIGAMQRAVNAGIVLVISAGNNGTDPKGANPDPFALVPAQDFPGSVIIAGSVGAAGANGTDLNSISDFSNRAGTGAPYYLTALGYEDQAPDQTGAQFLWSGTSFSAPAITGAVALMAQAFPNLTGKQIVSILFQTADDLGASGVDPIYGNGRLNIQRAFAPIGTMSLAGSQLPVATSDLPSASGDAATGQSVGAIVLDGYSRAYVLNLAATLRRANVDHPLSRSLQNDIRVSGAQAGPVDLAMTVSERHDLIEGYSIDRVGIGPEDLRRSRLVAGSAVARLNDRTAVALGFSEGAKDMERRLTGATSSAFLIATDVAGNPGFAAKRDSSMAVRHRFGGLGVTISGETGKVWQDVKTSATGSPYRLAAVAVDTSVARSNFSLALSSLVERQSLLGGHLSALLDGGGASTRFVDVQASHDFGSGWTGTLSGRRGWTGFTGGSLTTDAYALDLVKAGLLSDRDSVGLRIAQPLRVESGGVSMMLPTSWNYATETATQTLSTMSLSPSGREIDSELSYATSLRNGARLGANLYFRRQPGHIAALPDDIGGALRFAFTF